MYFFCSLALTMGLSLPIAAADTKGDAESSVRALAPFLEEGTVLVLHVDLARLNREDFVKQIGEVLAFDDKQKEEFSKALEIFLQAKGKEMFAIWNLDDVLRKPFLVVSAAENANVEVLTKLFRSDPAEDYFGFRPEAVKLHNAVVVGDKNQIEHLKKGKPAARPELAQALAAAEGTAAQLMFIPPANLRRSFEELVTTLPPELGGGPGTIVTHGLSWATLGIDVPPKGKFRLVIQAQNAAAARAFQSFLAHLGKVDQERIPLLRALPSFEKLAMLFDPKLEGDRLVLTMEAQAGGAAPLFTALAQFGLVGYGGITKDHLRQLAIAFHTYNDTYGHIPPAVFRDKQGKPLLSWRVHVLPFVGEDNLYKQFRLDEPWDSEHNQKLIVRMPPVFRGTKERLNKAGKTTFLVPHGQGTAFPEDGKEIKFPKDFPDGTSNTIWLVAADDDHAVIWTKPDDLAFDPENARAGLSGRSRGEVYVAMADGSVRSYPSKMNDQQFGIWFIRNSGKRRVDP